MLLSGPARATRECLVQSCVLRAMVAPVMAKSTTTKKKPAKRERKEQRFEPRSTTNPFLVQALGALGALALGAGVYGQFVRSALATGPVEPLGFAPWVLASGAIVLGVAIWLGTSGEPALRVGDGGVALEKNGERRIAWHAVEGVTFDAKSRSIVVRGTDETGIAVSIIASLRSHPDAAAAIAHEARLRAADVVSLEGSPVMPEPRVDAGELLTLDALQVVGRRCAESNTIIAYEPDARVCPRCERVYHKNHVPEACRCGETLLSLRPRKLEGEPEGAKPAPSDASIPPVDDSSEA